MKEREKRVYRRASSKIREERSHTIAERGQDKREETSKKNEE